MRTITHFHRTFGCDGATVGLRFYSMECELDVLRGLRIPQFALSVQSDGADRELECVDAAPDLAARFDAAPATADLQPLLDLLAERFDGQPMGRLAERAADLLGYTALAMPAGDRTAAADESTHRLARAA